MNVFELPQDMRDLYMKRRREDLSKCIDALSVSDFHQLSSVGHKIRGNALSFGFDRLGIVGEELERAAEKNDRDRSMQLLREFEAVLNEYHPL